MQIPQARTNGRIDQIMERASKALVRRDYFESERLASEALGLAMSTGDFERAARIALPLQESRRMIRDMAFDTRSVHVIDSSPPKGREIRPGMYLIAPPRVGVEGRLLREDALSHDVPVIVLVREPTTREGLWPVVAVGPVTIRSKVRPPAASKRRVRGGAVAVEPVPTPEWFISTSEHLGDLAISGVPAGASGPMRVLALYDRLCAIPDHEKLHQRFAEAAHAVVKGARAKPRRAHAAAYGGRAVED
ncbi:MAG: hypothetical protein KF869_08100 [Phycisphaeraceae bacterium]|nr:hypothetical protein [Phycisphaeraceae bacterium]